MNSILDNLLRELEQFTESNDASAVDRAHRMLNITRDTGEFLATLVVAMKAKAILEIGTSNGYSTLWLADAVSRTGGSIITIEYAAHKIALARENFKKAGLADSIQLVQDDAARALKEFKENQFDLIFLDSERSEYLEWWPLIKAALQPGGLLVVDNATSHVEEMRDFIAMVKSDKEFLTSLTPVGNGEFLAAKIPDSV